MNTLRHFKAEEVLLTNEQAARVLRYFFPDQPINPSDATPNDMAFAQALLVEAVDSTTKMGYVEELFTSTYMKVPVDFSLIEDVVKGLSKRALKNWFQHATGNDLKDPKIYEAVRRVTARNFRTVWALRTQTGELDY